MNRGPMLSQPPDDPSPPGDDESPDVPGFRTWRGIYWFVLGSFGAVVLALTIFARVFA